MSTKEVESGETGEFTISDELYEIAEATNNDGTVYVEIYDFEKMEKGYDHSRVKVFFRTPTLEEESEVMKWPRKDSNEYKFVRICEKTVGGLNAAGYLKTDGARIRADPDDWELKAELTRRESYRDSISDMTIRSIMGTSYKILGGIIAVSAGLLLIGIPIIGVLALFGAYPYALSGWVIALWFFMWPAFAIGMEIVPEPDD